METLRVFAVGPSHGGVADVFRRANLELRKRGHVVTDEALVTDGASAWSGLAGAIRARRGIRSADVVHIEFGSNDQAVFWFGLCAVFMRKDVVAVVHDYPKVANHPGAELLSRRSRLGRAVAYRVLAPAMDAFVKKQLLRRAGAVAAFGADACDGFARVGARAVVELTHGADSLGADALPPSRGESILFAGFLGAGKGVDVLLEAWRRRSADAGLPLVIAGGGGEDWIREVVGDSDQYAVAPTLLGAIPDEQDFQALIQRAAIVVLPYRSSSPASGIFVRALAAGRAIIATPVPATRALESGVNGLSVPIGDVDALAAALVELSNDPVRRDRLGAAAAATARELFNWDRHLDGLETAYTAARGHA